MCVSCLNISQEQIIQQDWTVVGSSGQYDCFLLWRSDFRILLKPAVFNEKFVFEKKENKQKEARFCQLKNPARLYRIVDLSN